MSIFEAATRGLRIMHNSEELRDLGEASELYYRAERKNEQLEKTLLETLTKENVEIINEMHDNFTTRETIAGEIHYNQGFSDAIQLIMQSLVWESVRR